MMATSPEAPGSLRRAALLCLLLGALAGCGAPPAEEETAAGESWSVTAWGERYEVFPEVAPLVAGETVVAHTHVTVLDGFSPMTDGEVEVVLSDASGEQVFAADRPVRPGIFAVEIEPRSPGAFDLAFRIRGPSGSEEIRGGQVRVGTAEEPGTLLRAPAPRGGTDGGEPLAFLKEEQWRSDFATAWVRSGELALSAAGLARVKPPAGGETSLTAPVDGVVRPASRAWPFIGLRVDRGSPLFQVVPHVAAERSLATLEAELAILGAELETTRGRLARLEELLALEATSRREVEEARTKVETLAARRSAAARDLEAARSAREGGSAGGLILRAPFAGEVAEVTTPPGATVAAGEALARLVRTDLVWLEVSLPPAGARRIAAEGVRGVVLTDPEHDSIRIEEGLRLVSVAPEVSPATGTVAVLFEAPARPGLVLGTALEAQVLSNERRPGVIIPASALVDDGGVPVVYLQLSGESFVRQEVHVQERQGELLLVEHLDPGQRLVTRGGDAIRRSSLMASGEAHGHVH
jgi:RND family efflux transporter MFP subunit